MAQKPPVLEQVERDRAQKDRERALRAMSAVLSTDDGKVALWYIVRMTKFFDPSLQDASSKIYANVADRDFGYKVLALMTNANEQAVFDLQRAEWHRAVEERLEDEKILKKERVDA